MVVKGQKLGPDPDVNAVGIPHEDVLIAVQESVGAESYQAANNVPAVECKVWPFICSLELLQVRKSRHKDAEPDMNKKDTDAERLEDSQAYKAPCFNFIRPQDGSWSELGWRRDPTYESLYPHDSESKTKGGHR
jgi:hypothetical protein